MMNKLSILKLPILLVSALCAFGYAALSYADYQLMAEATGLPETSGKFYISTGVAAMYMHNPEFQVATLGTSTEPLVKITDNGWTPRYGLGLGYQFFNARENWLTKLFGYQQSVEVRGIYFKKSERKAVNQPGEGMIWAVDGSGRIFPYTINIPFYNFSLTAQHQDLNAGIYFKGRHAMVNPRLSFSPYVGAIFYNEFEDDYKFSMHYKLGPEVSHVDTENFNVKTRSYGVAAGNRWDISLWKRISAFVDLQMQLLQFNSDLKVNQNAPTEGVREDDFSTKDSDKKISYHGMGSVGLNWQMLAKSQSPVVSLTGGVDAWGYSPSINTPHKTGDRGAHLGNEPMQNYTVELGMRVPLG